MIQVNELRVGVLANIATEDGSGGMMPMEYTEVMSIHIHRFEDFIIEPIPLTEEWLIKFGFEKRNENYYVSFFNYEMYYSSGSVDFRIGKYLLSNIKHVHSLQNLYFALTGEELTIKE